jgi:hypothetical protein
MWYRERPLSSTSGANANVSPIPSSNCLVLTPLFLCTQHIRMNPVCANERLLRRTPWLKPVLPRREAKEGGYQAARFKVGSDMWHTAIRSRYKAVRSTTSALAASISAEDQIVQSCPEASPIKWHQAHTTWFFRGVRAASLLQDYKPFSEEFRWIFNSYSSSSVQT